MRITVEAAGLEFTEPLEAYLDKKIGTLAKLLAHFEDNQDIEVRIELIRSTRHKKGEVYRVSGDIRLPKKVLRADATAEDVRKGIDQVRDMLRFDIEKYKEKSAPKKK